MLLGVGVILKTIKHVGGEGVVMRVKIGLGGESVGLDQFGWRGIELSDVGEGRGSSLVAEVGSVRGRDARDGNAASAMGEFGFGFAPETRESSWANVEAEVLASVVDGNGAPGG